MSEERRTSKATRVPANAAEGAAGGIGGIISEATLGNQEIAAEGLLSGLRTSEDQPDPRHYCAFCGCTTYGRQVRCCDKGAAAQVAQRSGEARLTPCVECSCPIPYDPNITEAMQLCEDCCPELSRSDWARRADKFLTEHGIYLKREVTEELVRRVRDERRSETACPENPDSLHDNGCRDYQRGYLQGYTNAVAVEKRASAEDPLAPRCFHVDAGKRCTRYLEGSQGERASIVKWLRYLVNSAGYPHDFAQNIEDGMHTKPRRESALRPDQRVITPASPAQSGCDPGHEETSTRAAAPDAHVACDCPGYGHIFACAYYQSPTPNACSTCPDPERCSCWTKANEAYEVRPGLVHFGVDGRPVTPTPSAACTCERPECFWCQDSTGGYPGAPAADPLAAWVREWLRLDSRRSNGVTGGDSGSRIMTPVQLAALVRAAASDPQRITSRAGLSSSKAATDIARADAWYNSKCIEGDSCLMSDCETCHQSLAALLADVRRETIEACARIAEETQPTMVDSGDIRIGRVPVYQPNPYAATVAANIRGSLFTRAASGGSDE